MLPGVIAEADLPALYRTANAFVFPSLKEGWGLSCARSDRIWTACCHVQLAAFHRISHLSSGSFG